MRSPCRKHPVDACEPRVSIAWGKETAMRRFLLAAVIAVLGTASVQAADLAAHYAKAPMMATAYSWTGFYVGRNGFLATPSWLIYATGGVAIADVKGNFNFTDTFAAATESGAIRDTRVGWTAGAGTEYAFGTGWSLTAEDLYVALG